MSDPYVSHSTGKLKLKGVKDSKISKSKKKSSSRPKGDAAPSNNDPPKDNSVVLKHLEEEDARITRDKDDALGSDAPTAAAADDASRIDDDEDGGGGQEAAARKTPAERRWEEQRRKRLEDRLKKEGVKTHKERVEELNRYLSGLSEHHDMPKIGPG